MSVFIRRSSAIDLLAFNKGDKWSWDAVAGDQTVFSREAALLVPVT